GKDEIGQHEFFQALQTQRDALQERTHAKVDIENKDFRKGVLDQIVEGHLMSYAGTSNGLMVPAGDLEAVIQSAPVFQDNGVFSEERFQTWLHKQGLTKQGLLRMIQQDSMAQQVQVGYGQGAIMPAASVAQVASLLVQQREVNEAVFSGNAYTNAISIDDKAVESDYNAHKQDYAIPEQVRVQYVVLSADSIRSGIEISDQTAQQFYDANKAKFSEPEQRRASHILIKADSSMSAADKAAAKAKAEKLYQELRANPARFAELAKQDSQDPGSAAQGGDLGSFTRDTMVKPFADAAFSMKVGELRGPVESEFGYHIIRLDAITPGKVAPFAAVKPGIVAQLAQQEAERIFAEAAEKFSNMVYEQSDSLDPAAKQFHLNVQESGWISRDHAIPAFLAKTDLMDAMFGQDSLEKHQNTEAIEVAPNMLVSARVLEHKPSGTRPLSEVAGEIRAKLIAQAARAKAIEAGQQALKMAQAGQTVTGLGAPMTISRMQPLNLPAESIKVIFAANASKLPTSVGVETPDGYRLYRITKVASVPPDATRLTQLQHDLTGIVMKEEIKAYLSYVKAKAGVKINDAILEKKAE
ncbi:MAG: peptidylprolyl isomerase, partial [Parasulfuritortus sp.]|nr:peptidylprolyl isomerase [Parasulfuritortus sp.]